MSVSYDRPDQLFYYRYMLPENKLRAGAPGGFSFTIFSNGTLNYSSHRQDGGVIGYTLFRLANAAEITQDMETLFGYFTWWLTGSGLSIDMENGRAAYRSEFGIKNHPLFEVDEIERLANDEFLSDTGHFARRFRLLLEDVAEMLTRSGIFVNTNSFTWRKNAVIIGEGNGEMP